MKNFKQSKAVALYLLGLVLSGVTMVSCEKAVAAKEDPELIKVYGESDAELTAPPLVPRPVGKRAATKLIVDMEVVEKEMEMSDGVSYVYWKDAGHDRKIDTKTLTLRLFEEKYLEEFISTAKKVRGRTVEDKLLALDHPSDALVTKIKEFDRIYNVEWPLMHLKTAEHYLDRKGENKAATGGSPWKKYLHPKYQQRKFFPSFWTQEEIDTWGT